MSPEALARLQQAAGDEVELRLSMEELAELAGGREDPRAPAREREEPATPAPAREARERPGPFVQLFAGLDPQAIVRRVASEPMTPPGLKPAGPKTDTSAHGEAHHGD